MPRQTSKTAPVAAAAAAAVRGSSKRPTQGTPPTRQSKRARTSARQSYAEVDSDGDENEEKKVSSKPDSGDDPRASDFEEADDDVGPSSDSEQQEPSSSDDNVTSTLSVARGRPPKKSLPSRAKVGDEKELWKPGAKLAPGTQVIIKKPKARDAGDTPYADDTIHPNTMLFLKDLATNNDRQWLKLHDADYRAALQDFKTFTEKLSEKVVEADETIPELPVKDVVYRIYRDVRFSKDPTPYKTYFSAAWSRTGRKGPYAHYYAQIKPGGSFVGGGLWQPDAAALAKLRRDIDGKPHRIKEALMDAGIRSAFLGNVGQDEKKAVEAFVNLPMNQSNALKRNPKGYEQDHKEIDLLRLRNFTLGADIADNEVTGASGLKRMAELVARMVPFIRYVNRVVMPDEDGSAWSDEDSEDDDSEEAGGSATAADDE
ncbi:hypothetical protein ACEQ8H_003843 [Pleosporales sp. CAS-2024a]